MAARKDIDRAIQGGTLAPVFAIFSEDPVLLSDAVTSLRKKVLTVAPDFNRDELRAQGDGVSRAIAAARTMPMMAPRRWVHLTGVDKLNADDQAALLAYLEAPSSSTVFCLSGEGLDQRMKLAQRLNKEGWLFVLEVPKQRELPGWIEQRAKRHGVDIDSDAAFLLADLVGADLGALDMALLGLAAYAGGTAGSMIDVAAVEDSIAPTRVHSIFELTDAVGRRELGSASLLLRNALGGGESGIMVLSMLTRHLRQLIQVKGGNSQGVPPFLQQQLRDQAKRYSDQELRRGLYAALVADIALKSTRLDAGVVLDRMLLSLMGGEQGRG